MTEINGQEQKELPPIEIHGMEKRVIGDHVMIKQGAVQSLEANDVVLRQGGIVISKAISLSTQNSGILFSQAQQANFSSSAPNFSIINGNASLDQSGAKVLIVNGNAFLDQSGSLLLAAKEVQGENINTVFFLGKNVNGNIHTAFGSKETILFGIITGAVLGIFLFISKLFLGKKK